MDELTLIGLHDDGEDVVVEGPDGTRFRLPIDEALRAAVRRDRPRLELARAEASGALPPREIQSRIRAGASAEEVADEAGVDVDLVRRYEGPVIAEREYVAQQARGTRIGRDPDAPVLGDLVTDRLATRGVDPATVHWDASRRGGSPWTVEVRFDVGGDERSARWTYDSATRSVRADDDEARWLSETELRDEPVPRRHLAAVRGTTGGPGTGTLEVDVDAAVRPLLAAVDLPLEAEPTEESDPTHALLDDLRERRGVRQEADVPDDEEDDDEDATFGPQHAFDFDRPGTTTAVPAAHPPASRPDQALDATVLQMPPDYRERRRAAARSQDRAAEQDGPEAGGSASSDAPQGDATRPSAKDADSADSAHGAEGAGGTAGPESTQGGEPVEPPEEEVPPPLAGRGRSRKGRASVPSWDEIVFGAKPE